MSCFALDLHLPRYQYFLHILALKVQLIFTNWFNLIVSWSFLGIFLILMEYSLWRYDIIQFVLYYLIEKEAFFDWWLIDIAGNPVCLYPCHDYPLELLFGETVKVVIWRCEMFSLVFLKFSMQTSTQDLSTKDPFIS